jgi:hypothetical protein
MGFFTWTDARREPRKRKNGDYSIADKIGYGGYAKVVCPDDTEIIEQYYDGYGEFDGHDIYDLVVDWNKNYLEDIFNQMSEDHWGYRFKEIAIAFQNDDTYALNKEIARLIDSYGEPQWIRDEWKRHIGITIACGDKDNMNLPYPIKITTTKWHRKYDELYPSLSCQ